MTASPPPWESGTVPGLPKLCPPGRRPLRRLRGTGGTGKTGRGRGPAGGPRLTRNQYAAAGNPGKTGPGRKSVDAPVDNRKKRRYFLGGRIIGDRQGLKTLRENLRWFPTNRPRAVVSVRVTKLTIRIGGEQGRAAVSVCF